MVKPIHALPQGCRGGASFISLHIRRQPAFQEHVNEVLAQPEDLNSPTTPTAASSLAPPTPSSPPATSQATPARAPSPNPPAVPAAVPAPPPPASPTPPSTSTRPPKAPSPSNSSDGRGSRSGSGHWWQRLTRRM